MRVLFCVLIPTIVFLPPCLARGVDCDAGPMVLLYDKPAAEWVEALPIGNGRIGAMVFGRTANERIQFNEDSFWAGGPHDPVNPEALAALPEARRLIFGGKDPRCETWLSVYPAEKEHTICSTGLYHNRFHHYGRHFLSR